MLKKASVLFLSLALLLCLAPVVQADFSTPSKNLSNSPSYQSKYPKVQWIQGNPPVGNVFVIWVETDGTSDYLYFSKSMDSGTTWSTPYQMTSWGQILTQSDLADDYAFSFVVNDPYIHVVFQHRADASSEFDIYYMGSSDLGDTWNQQQWLTDNTYESRFPDIDARGTYVHVAYQDNWPGNEEIMYKRITNYGAGSVDQTRRLTFSSSMSYYPRIAVSQSGLTVNIVYEEETALGVMNIFHKVFGSSGAGAYYTHQLTYGTTSGTDWNGLPDIAASTGVTTDYFYIVYQAFWPGNREIMYKRIDNWGFDPFNVYTARLTYSTSESRSNSISFDGAYNYVHVSYNDNWPGNHDVMYKKFSNYGGGSFTTQRVSWGTGDSAHSTLAAHGAWAHIVWSDNSSGNYEIYWKNGY